MWAHCTEVACSLLGLAGSGSDSVVESSSCLATLLLFVLLLATGTSSSELLDAAGPASMSSPRATPTAS